MSIKRQFAHGAFWMVLGTSFNQIAAFAVFVVLSRILSPHEFGLVAMATMFIDITKPIFSTGVSDAMVRQPEWTQEIASTAFWLNLAIATAVAIGSIVIVLPILSLSGYHSVNLIFVIFAGTLIIDALGSVADAKLRRSFQYKKLTQRIAIGSVTSGLIGIGFALAGFGVWALVAQRVIGSLLGVALVWSQARWWPSFIYVREEARHLFRFSTGLVGAQLLSNFNGQVAGFVIGFGLGPSALALYRAGNRILTIATQLVISPIQRVALTAFSRVGDRSLIPNIYERLTGACAIIACPVFIGAGAVGYDLVPALFGPKWTESGGVMMMSSVVIGVSVINYFFTPSLAAVGNTRGSVFYFASAIVGNALFGLLAVPFGLLAVVLSQTVRGYLGLPVSLMILKREIGLHPLRLVSRVTAPLFCALAMGAVIVAVRHYWMVDWTSLHRLLVLTPLGALIYCGLMAVFGRSVVTANFDELRPLLPAFLVRRFAS